MNEHGVHWVTLAGLEHVHEVRHKEVRVCFNVLMLMVLVFTAHRSILLAL